MDLIITATDVCYLDFLRFPPIAIERGCATFISGESGCGKTTLLKLFNATISPSAGTICFDGFDMENIEPIVLRRQVLLAGQAVYLFDDTIRGNFERFYDYRGEPCIDEDRMRECLYLCSLDFPLIARCQTLSGGERQRVFLAIHLSMNPKVLMLDEPTSALDKKTARQMLARLKAYCGQAEITLVVACHDPALVESFADHVITLPREGCP